MLKMLIVGTSHTINDRLEEMFREQDGHYTIKKMTTLSAALPELETSEPAIMLVSNNLPETNFSKLLKQVKNNFPKLHIIILADGVANKSFFNKIGIHHIIDIYHEFDQLPALVAQIKP